MSRPSNRPHLEVQESFETTRLSPRLLSDAYNRLVPVQRKTIRKTDTTGPPTAAERTGHRGGQHV